MSPSTLLVDHSQLLSYPNPKIFNENKNTTKKILNKKKTRLNSTTPTVMKPPDLSLFVSFFAVDKQSMLGVGCQ